MSRLEAQGAIVLSVARLQASGRAGTRYFAADVGLLEVRPDGLAGITTA